MLASRSISARAVLEADLRMRGIGVRRAVRQLERDEPELAEYLMETSTRLYARLDRSCREQRTAAALNQHAVLMTLICIDALRRSV
jgi:hypothetical protein